MNKSVVVYGPQGCGKTLFAAELARHFGLAEVVDEYFGEPLTGPQKVGTLFLGLVRPAWADADSQIVHDFFDVLQSAGLLYHPRLIHRDATDGTFIHPHLPAHEDPDSEDDITPLVTAQGYAIVSTYPDDSLEDVEGDDYWAALRAWEPTPPIGQGWLLAGIVDTEDGASSWWVRPISQTDKQPGVESNG